MPQLAGSVQLRLATATDQAFCQQLAPGLSPALFAGAIRNQRFQIIEASGQPVGFLKDTLLWESKPFLEILQLLPEWQRQGLGRAAVVAWEQQLRAQGHALALLTTQPNESAQHFWRRLRYQDCGVLTIPNHDSELFLYKQLRV